HCSPARGRGDLSAIQRLAEERRARSRVCRSCAAGRSGSGQEARRSGSGLVSTRTTDGPAARPGDERDGSQTKERGATSAGGKTEAGQGTHGLLGNTGRDARTSAGACQKTAAAVTRHKTSRKPPWPRLRPFSGATRGVKLTDLAPPRGASTVRKGRSPCLPP